MATPPLSVPRSLHAIALLYGGMTVLAGILGAKQVALGPLAVEAGIFAFLLLVVLSSATAELHGRATANRLVLWGFLPLGTAIGLIAVVLALPTDEGMWEPAKEAFPIILGQNVRIMLAGVCAYGVSQFLNVAIFARLGRVLGGRGAGWLAVKGAVASATSQIVDTLIFVTVAFLGVRPIAELIAGQALAKVVLSVAVVPVLIAGAVALGRRMDRAATE